jgi:hypothetical protein
VTDYERKCAAQIERLRAALTEASGGWPYRVFVRGIENGELVLGFDPVALPTPEGGWAVRTDPDPQRVVEAMAKEGA